VSEERGGRKVESGGERRGKGKMHLS